jgi:hypothetical protein
MYRYRYRSIKVQETIQVHTVTGKDAGSVQVQPVMRSLLKFAKFTLMEIHVIGTFIKVPRIYAMYG